MVLKGYLYVGTFLCILCGFNIFDARAVFRMDACHLFPQHVLVVLLLTGVFRCCGWCLVLGFSAMAGCSDVPLGHAMGGSSSQLLLSLGTGSRGPEPLLGSELVVAEVCDCFWRPCRQCLPLCKYMHSKRATIWVLSLPSCTSQTMATGF